MKTVIPFKSNKNFYLYFLNNKSLTITHPILFFLVDVYNRNNYNTPNMLESCLEDLKKDYSWTDIEYYYNLFVLYYQNGCFDDSYSSEKFSGRLENGELNKLIANIKQLTFETTERCNLDCEYCGYGELYDGYAPRHRRDLPAEYAIDLINYLSEFWNSDENTSYGRPTHISFYGGEPLLSFDFIEKVVKYCKQLRLDNNELYFSMTTNALLLKKYIDFLVEYDFHILISLDGNEGNHSYRRFKNGENSHEAVLSNVLYVQERYPEYFKERINFNAVLHNRNSVEEITNYIESNFDKLPSIGELSTSGISKQNQKKFWETYNNFNECLHDSENYENLTEKLFLVTPVGKQLTNFLMKSIYYNKDDFNDLIYEKQKVFSPTGTCAPFSKKLFVTAQGYLLSCEKIEHKYALGKVDSSGVNIDLMKVKNLYNENYDKLYKLCSRCYNSFNCVQCMFFLDLEKEKVACQGFTSYENYRRQLKNIMIYLEEHPEKKHEIQDKFVFSF